jgi:hypothetical protein
VYQVYAGITSRVVRNCASRTCFDSDSFPEEVTAAYDNLNNPHLGEKTGRPYRNIAST